MIEKTILHIDVNNYYASVECTTNPNLKDKPLAVTGNPEKRTGIILAKNQIAKSFGIKTGETIWQAKQKCPELITMGPHYALYEKISKQLHELYLQYTDFVEPLGLDECWLDVTNSLNYLKKTGQQIADELREKVKKQFGFTVSVGVSFSKLFAKLGSDLRKPDFTTIIEKEKFKEKTYHLPLNSIIGIGSRLEKKFEKMNITTIGEFASLKIEFVSDIMGKTGFELWHKLNGSFDEKVANYYLLAPPKSIGNGTTTITDVKTREEIKKVIVFLSEKVAFRLHGYQASTITVTLKTNNFEKYRHSRTISPIQTLEEISEQAMNLVDSFWKYDQYVRAIRVRVSSLKKTDKAKQLSFFDQTNLEDAINSIKNKYGKNKIFIASDGASFINRKNENEEQK